MKRFLGVLGLAAMTAAGAAAAPCGNDGSGFEAWKAEFAREAAGAGVGQRGIEALMAARYATETIRADRNQRSFRYSLQEFMRVRGADAIVSQGRRLKERNAAFYQSIEASFGVPAGILIAIHGMETGFGRDMGSSNLISATASLAYDCRRPDFFTGHLLAALRLVDQGAISSQTTGAKHGELGHTQFLPGNALAYGLDGNGDGRVDLRDMADAMVSTANFLRQKGWRPGGGYQEGEANFAVLKEWNAAGVYQKALAIMGAQIDG